jgi:hypothetical protein
MDNVHEQLSKAGVELDHHASDLYAKRTPVSERILRGYEHRRNVTTFRSNVDGTVWYDIPFAYMPFWDRVSRLSGKVAAGAAKGPVAGLPEEARKAGSLLHLAMNEAANVLFELSKESGWHGATRGYSPDTVLRQSARNLREASAAARAAGAVSEQMAQLAERYVEGMEGLAVGYEQLGERALTQANNVFGSVRLLEKELRAASRLPA